MLYHYKSTNTDSNHRKQLEFWDLLDFFRNADCPAKTLRTLGRELDSLQAFAGACLVKDNTLRPRATELLHASFPAIHTR